MWAEQYVVYDWIRLYADCDTTRRNFLSAILRNADKGVFLLHIYIYITAMLYALLICNRLCCVQT